MLESRTQEAVAIPPVLLFLFLIVGTILIGLLGAVSPVNVVVLVVLEAFLAMTCSLGDNLAVPES